MRARSTPTARPSSRPCRPSRRRRASDCETELSCAGTRRAPWRPRPAAAFIPGVATRPGSVARSSRRSSTTAAAISQRATTRSTVLLPRVCTRLGPPDRPIGRSSADRPSGRLPTSASAEPLGGRGGAGGGRTPGSRPRTRPHGRRPSGRRPRPVVPGPAPNPRSAAGHGHRRVPPSAAPIRPYRVRRTEGRSPWRGQTLGGRRLRKQAVQGGLPIGLYGGYGLVAERGPHP